MIDSCYFFPANADRPIASIAFHAKGELLAVASGHKVGITVGNFIIKLLFFLYKIENCILFSVDDLDFTSKMLY